MCRTNVKLHTKQTYYSLCVGLFGFVKGSVHSLTSSGNFVSCTDNIEKL